VNVAGLPVISLHAYDGLLSAFAHAGTSLAGIEVGLLVISLQAYDGLFVAFAHVETSLAGIEAGKSVIFETVWL
jgi:hypothetical protein